MTIIIDGKPFPQLDSKIITRNWLTHPSQIKGNAKHCNPRTRFVRAIMLHTVHGTADDGVVETNYAPGEDPSAADLTYAKYQGNTTREVSWHFTVDTDGSIAQNFDPVRDVCWHGNQCNTFTVGVEIVQASAGDMTTASLASVVALCDLLTGVRHKLMAIPRQIFGERINSGQQTQANPAVFLPLRGILEATLTENGSGSKICGVYGHRNVGYRAKNNSIKGYRGHGDPGNAPFMALVKEGYEAVPVVSRDDVLGSWKTRQKALGSKAADGIYGPDTAELVATALGNKSGQYVLRPVDSLL